MSEEQLWVPASRSRKNRAPRPAQFLADQLRAPSRFSLRTTPGPVSGRSATGVPTIAAPVILISGSQPLQDEVARIAAAAGVELEVMADADAAAQRNPEVLLLGSDLAAGSGHHVPQGGPGLRRPEVILVGTAQDTELWQEAARREAARVAVLPEASGWLAEYLGRRRGKASGFVVGVVGGSGGAGASTLSCWLAHEAAERRVETLLVDGDPCGGGLDASLGSGDVPGVRWPDLADVRGTLNPVQLVSALPQVSGFALLSGDSGEARAGGGTDETWAADSPSADYPADESISAVMDAARGAFALTIVDCARQPSNSLLLSCDALLLVVPGRLRPVLAARSLTRSLGAAVPKAAVVRGPLGDGLDDARAADAAGLSLAGYLPAARRLEHAEARGLLLQRGRSRSIRRVTGQLVERFAAELPVPASAMKRLSR